MARCKALVTKLWPIRVRNNQIKPTSQKAQHNQVGVARFETYDLLVAVWPRIRPPQKYDSRGRATPHSQIAKSSRATPAPPDSQQQQQQLLVRTAGGSVRVLVQVSTATHHAAEANAWCDATRNLRVLHATADLRVQGDDAAFTAAVAGHGLAEAAKDLLLARDHRITAFRSAPRPFATAVVQPTSVLQVRDVERVLVFGLLGGAAEAEDAAEGDAATIRWELRVLHKQQILLVHMHQPMSPQQSSSLVACACRQQTLLWFQTKGVGEAQPNPKQQHDDNQQCSFKKWTASW
eukprot:CAMPEP_0183502522 /NCGR_PEP_ID=MMETSP0371-20130417/4279_1 /TAXON_ID=268820 /ORGANISM="Peridinium aciculiferum, Strain PAER-2" /LENGTH=291 /DNA_ID=CAMNT_0025697257 /DNA_START=14 /DNA_END=888 /DNA_ORIENTATION=+